MSAALLQSRLDRHLEHARAAMQLDEDLGTLHGIGWREFVLLTQLESAGGSLGPQALAQQLGLGRAQLVLALMPMEKTGLIAREGEGAARRVTLRPAGRQCVREARETAAACCKRVA